MSVRTIIYSRIITLFVASAVFFVGCDASNIGNTERASNYDELQSAPGELPNSVTQLNLTGEIFFTHLGSSDTDVYMYKNGNGKICDMSSHLDYGIYSVVNIINDPEDFACTINRGEIAAFYTSDMKASPMIFKARSGDSCPGSCDTRFRREGSSSFELSKLGWWREASGHRDYEVSIIDDHEYDSVGWVTRGFFNVHTGFSLGSDRVYTNATIRWRWSSTDIGWIGSCSGAAKCRIGPLDGNISHSRYLIIEVIDQYMNETYSFSEYVHFRPLRPCKPGQICEEV